ncbi:unnamed protein product, partial [Iphiclides podalirius]
MIDNGTGATDTMDYGMTKRHEATQADATGPRAFDQLTTGPINIHCAPHIQRTESSTERHVDYAITYSQMDTGDNVLLDTQQPLAPSPFSKHANGASWSRNEYQPLLGKYVSCVSPQDLNRPIDKVDVSKLGWLRRTVGECAVTRVQGSVSYGHLNATPKDFLTTRVGRANASRIMGKRGRSYATEETTIVKPRFRLLASQNALMAAADIT